MLTLPQVKRHTFTVEEYTTMTRAGVFDEDDRVELIEGELIEMSPIGATHAGSLNRLLFLFTQSVKGQAIVSVQNPIRLDEHSEPQPDLVVAKYRADFYKQAHPTPGDVLLVVEVSDTTLELDQRIKVPLYARANIAEAWIVNLVDLCVEVYRQPVEGNYREKRIAKAGEWLTLEALPELRLSVREVLE